MFCRRAALALVAVASWWDVSDASLLRSTSSSQAVVVAASEEARQLDGDSIEIVGDNGYPTEAFPLGLCQGDCDNDDECEGDLICYQRDEYQPVPGCDGGESEGAGADVCVSPGDGNSGGGGSGGGGSDSSSGGSTGSTGYFNLKLYWQFGYHWQGETFERKWCMRCYKGHCVPGAEALIADCDNGGPAEVYFEKFGGDDFRIRVKNTNICLEIPSDLQLYLSWETCSTSDLQRFTGQNGDPYGGGRFQLEPKTLPDHCITITHHPKSGERLWVATCEYTLPNDTTFWNPYP